jgi:hypothetical protein
VTPLGSNTAYSVNFALICATHQDLAAQVAAGAFREDLLYRIQEFHLRIRLCANGPIPASLSRNCGKSWAPVRVILP